MIFTSRTAQGRGQYSETWEPQMAKPPHTHCCVV